MLRISWRRQQWWLILVCNKFWTAFLFLYVLNQSTVMTSLLTASRIHINCISVTVPYIKQKMIMCNKPYREVVAALCKVLTIQPAHKVKTTHTARKMSPLVCLQVSTTPIQNLQKAKTQWLIYDKCRLLAVPISPRPEVARLMFERGLYLFGNKVHWISHSHI